MGVLDLFSLSGKTAVVTGGFTGIGKQTAEAFLEAGANVAVCARRPEKWQESFHDLEETAKRNGKRLMGTACDVSLQADVERFVEEVAGGLGAIDILVNAAGIAWVSPPETMKLEDWNKVLQTNLTGTFLCSQTVGRTMIARKKGNIINVSSVLGLVGSSPAVLDAVAYSTSKASVIGFTRDLAIKWVGHNIRVNALLPGWFVTHMTEKVVETRSDKLLMSIPMGRLGSETDLKGAAVFLASEASSYVTGQLICVDGGLTAGR